MIKYILVLLLAFPFTACTRDLSPDTYSVGAVGQANRTMRGTIVNVREVNIQGNQTGIGGLSGAAGGAVAGSAIGNGGRSNALGAIGGAVIGGIAGAVIEEGTTSQKGLEYVIETENDNLITVVQGLTPSLSKKQKILVIYGNPTRVIPDTK